jgi:hypothetical protein
MGNCLYVYFKYIHNIGKDLPIRVDGHKEQSCVGLQRGERNGERGEVIDYLFTKREEEYIRKSHLCSIEVVDCEV